MTGILPIKKDGSQSAISEFREYSMLKLGRFAAYAGFLEEDVKKICRRKNVSFEKMREWYDGYSLRTVDGECLSVYNPNSVILAAEDGVFDSYWEYSSAAYSALKYINMDFDGLGEAVEKLTAGLEIPVKTKKFQNDLMSFRSANDVLTLLVHFGYLTYDSEKGIVRIPNYEIQTEFGDMICRLR